MPAVDPYPYVYVNADGTARELHPSEQKYLETEFKGGDGAAPYVKSSHAERDGWGELTGYLKRSLLPDGAPSTTRRPQTRSALSAERSTSPGCAARGPKSPRTATAP
jgi:hypothetical protein